MASFFQQIIDLGDESATRANDHPLDEDINRMSRDELRAEYRKVNSRITDRDGEITQLREDASKLQSRFDAYKKKVDGWQQQMKELRSADKKALEEFRAASAVGGEVGDTYVKSLEEKIAALKQATSEAQEEATTAFRRQRDAEQGRAALEMSAKKDYDELFARFTAFKEKSRSTQERYEAQINSLSEEVARMNEMAPSPSPVRPTNYDESELIKSLKKEIHALKNETPRKQPQQPEIPTAREVEAPIGESEADPQHSPAKLTEDAPDAGQQHDDTAVVGSEERGLVDELRATVGRNEEALEGLRVELAASKLRDQAASKRVQVLESEIRTLQEEAEWKGVEVERNLSEVRSTAESWKAKHMEVITQLEERDARLAVLERHAERSASDEEHSRKLEIVKFEKLLELEQKKQAALQLEMSEMQQRLSHHDAKVATANENTDRATAELRTIQATHAAALSERDARIKQLLTIVEIKEGAAIDSKEEATRALAQLEAVRGELHLKEAAMRSVEFEQADVQRVLASREDDLHGRERERQSLRARLQDEEDKCTELRGALRECELKVAELDSEGRRREQARSVAIEDNMRLMADKEHLEDSISTLQKQVSLKDSQLSELGRRIQEQAQQGSVVTEGEGGKGTGGGGHSTIVEQFEIQVARLERELRISKEDVSKAKKALESALVGGSMNSGGEDANPAPTSTGGGQSGGGGGADTFTINVFGSQLITRNPLGQRFESVNDVFKNARRSVVVKDIVSQITWKTVVVGVLLLLTLTSMWSGSRAVSSVHSRDDDSLSILQEKYSQVSVALSSCQSALKGGSNSAAVPHQ